MESCAFAVVSSYSLTFAKVHHRPHHFHASVFLHDSDRNFFAGDYTKYAVYNIHIIFLCLPLSMTKNNFEKSIKYSKKRRPSF